MENNMELAIVNRVKLFLGELKRDIKAIFLYGKMDRKNSDRKIRMFNLIVNANDAISDMWICRFVRQCDLPLKDGELSIFGIHGHKVVIRMNRSKYKIFFTVENVHVKDSYWERFNDNLINDKSINISLGFDYLEHDKYLRFPFWIMTFLEPNDTIETIREKIKNVNQVRLSAWQRRKACPMICRLDYFGDRAYFADEVSKVLEIKYAGIFRHNDDELHKKYNNNKIDYIKQFMFCLCPENSNTKGYVTEKLFDAITAGCFPIYWGSDNMPEPDIVNQEAVIFLNLHGDNVESLAKITRLLTDEAYCKKFAEIPVFVEGAEYKMYAYLENLRDKLWRMVK